MVDLIVLTDFSDAADNASNYANKLAGLLSAHVYLTHIWDNSILNPDYFLNSHAFNSEKEIKNVLQKRSLAFDKSLVVEPVLLKGSINEQLTAFIKRFSNPSVVIGKCFTENIPDEMVSSTSLHLLDIEDIALLVIPERFRSVELPKRITFAWDGRSFGLKDQVFTQLYNALNADLKIVQVSQTPERFSEQEHLEDAKELLGLETSKATLDITQGESVVECIHKSAENFHAKLLTFIIRKRPFLNQLFHTSTTAEFIRHTSIPLLILHG